MNEECKDLFGRKRCWFEPRYNKGSPGNVKGDFTHMSESAFLDFIEKTRTVTYVCDVCVRCGKTTKPGEAA